MNKSVTIFLLLLIFTIQISAPSQPRCILVNGSSDYVNIGNMGPRPKKGTITFWINPVTVQNYRDVMTTSPLGTSNCGNNGIRFEEHAGGFFQTVIGGDVTDCVNGYIGPAYTNTGLQANTWYHIALVWDSTANNIKAYLNGALAFDMTNTLWPTNFAQVKIGVGWDFSRYWQGKIDEITMWKTNLNASSIASVMNGNINTADTNLYAYWSFDDNAVNGQGQTVLNKALSTTGLYNGTTFGTATTPIFVLSDIPVPPQRVSLISPSNNSTNQPIALMCIWNKPISTLALTGYWYELFTDTTVAPVLRDTLLTDTTRSLSSLLNGTNYWWRVKAKNSSGYGLFSTFFKFTTIVGIPSAPNLISPPNNSTGIQLAPTLTWSNSTWATQYRVLVSSDSTFSTTQLDSTLSIDSIHIPSGRLANNVKYYWHVRAINLAGNSSYSALFNFTTSLVGITNYNQVAQAYRLYDAFPNPFNPTTVIKFSIPKSNLTKLSVYDITGRETVVLLSSVLSAGEYEITFDASDLASGIYFYKLESGEFSLTKKMILKK